MRRGPTLIVPAVLACLASIATVAMASLVLAGDATSANPVPEWDHYKTYMVYPELPITLHQPVYLKDQFDDEFGFGKREFTVDELRHFGLPVRKDGSQYVDSTAHLTWWTISGPDMAPPTDHVLVTNQFGTDMWLWLQDARYLLAPALKNPDAADEPLPTTINHFKCYDAIGPDLMYPTVQLIDQFGTQDVRVERPEVFCNPVEKTTVDGAVFPIVDPANHLVCYRISPMYPVFRYVSVMDQFIWEYVELRENLYLCVPSMKTGITQTQQSTWGEIKALYR